jgi:hypothetical protein
MAAHKSRRTTELSTAIRIVAGSQQAAACSPVPDMISTELTIPLVVATDNRPAAWAGCGLLRADGLVEVLKSHAALFPGSDLDRITPERARRARPNQERAAHVIGTEAYKELGGVNVCRW